jgi:hypothetical protein
MIKSIVIVIATAVPAFGAGIWTQATLAEHQRTQSRVVSITSTISPSEMQRKIMVDDLPVQHMQGDFN